MSLFIGISVFGDKVMTIDELVKTSNQIDDGMAGRLSAAFNQTK